ncbi:MAG: hypothetical protein ACE15B_21380 [Bryobacteraceae bacterium]
MDRREFMHGTALTGAFAAFYGGVAEGGIRRSGVPGHVTMTALAGDCIRLAMCSEAIPAGAKEILARNQELVRIGGLVHLPVESVPQLLDASRGKKAGDREQALVLGSLVERAAGQFQPALGDSAECDLYRDVTLLREMGLPQGGVNRAAPAELYDLLLTLETRRLIAIHTFSPDAGDTDGWLAGLIQWRRDCRTLLKRYAEVLCAPDAELTRKYVSGPGFYARQDGIIQLARAVQNGAVISRAALAPALRAAPSLSQYARALGKGHDYLAAAGAYTAGSIDAGTLIRRVRGK